MNKTFKLDTTSHYINFTDLFIDKVDTKLLESVELENLEAGNIQYTNEVDFLHGWVNQGSVTHVHKVTEETTKDILDDGGSSDSDGSQVLSLVDPLSSDLVLGVDEAIVEDLTTLSELENVIADFTSSQGLGRGDFSDSGKLQGGQMHANRGHSVHIVLLSLGEAKNVKSFVHDLHLLSVIDRFDLDLTHGHAGVIVDVVGQLASLVKVNLVSDHEVEDMVGSLVGGLVGHTRLLKEIGLNISTGHLTHVVEPHTDELSESGGVVVPHSLGIAIGLQDRVGLDDLVLKGSLLLFALLDLLASAGAHKGEVGDDLLGVLSFSGSRLSGNQDGLILTL